MAELKTDAEGNFIKVEGSDDSEQELDHRPITEVHAGGDSPVMVDAEKRKLEERDKDEGGGEGGGGDEMGDAGAKKQKISIGFNKTFGAAKTIHEKKSPAPITIKLGTQKTKDTRSTLKQTSASVASAFNQDSDEEEEMPPEAKMRMRNIGRDTPTSAGPNSFGKTRQGFCDAKKVFERQLKKKMEEVSDK